MKSELQKLRRDGLAMSLGVPAAPLLSGNSGNRRTRETDLRLAAALPSWRGLYLPEVPP